MVSLLAKVDPIAHEVGAVAPWRATRARQLDRTTLAELAKPFLSDRISPVFEAVNNSSWGVDSDQLSLLYVASYVAAGNQSNRGSFCRLVSTVGGARQWRFVGGHRSSLKGWLRGSETSAAEQPRARVSLDRRTGPGRGRGADG